MEPTVKITPRVVVQVARLAAGVRSRCMSVVARDPLDEVLPSLEEIRLRPLLPAPEAGAAGLSPDLRLGPPGLLMLSRGGPAVSPVPVEGTGDGGGR